MFRISILILITRSLPCAAIQHYLPHASTTSSTLLLLHFPLVEVTTVPFQWNMVRPRIVDASVRHFVRHMRKKRPHQRPKHDINRVVPRISDLAEREQDSDTPRRHKQHKFPMMHPPHRFSPLTSLLCLLPIVISKVPAPR